MLSQEGFKTQVSPGVIDVIAHLALTTLVLGDEAGPAPEYSLGNVGANEAFVSYVCDRFNIDDPWANVKTSAFVSGLGEGFKIGLCAATAISSDPLNLNAICASIEAEFQNESPYWAESIQSPKEATQ